ncbi:MAG: DUF6111 family protein [Stappiaceae bacterium]
MLRIVLIHFALFLLPFVAYAIWISITRRAQSKPAWRDGPNFWLASAGLVLVVGSLLILGTFRDAPSGASYTRAEFKDGKLIPGGYEKPADR